ncbi:ParA family protein [Burkholderia cenocepacia]|uniref:ParA family protein n=1 Tax=Burkholderia cenocepacia TaxID=95486 RepID=UPI0013E00C87|nr:ParA family protein [Burkholderia cenocepacia]MCW3587408.1 ParA family protein [Burkholderia cenocepacia]MCW3632612.1 ParA family protein [Burkholderia cenocepacia]MCW5181843.1 ParA family protein [Burkholderia cenocepacia]
MKIVPVVTQKGGVGKTTVSFNLAKAAADVFKLRAAVIDLDGQANLSISLTGNLDIKHTYEGGADGLFRDGPFPKATKTSHGIDLFHGHAQIDRIDNDEEIYDRALSIELRDRLRKLPYDVIIVDTPPAIGLRHMAPLYWANTVVIPMEPNSDALLGAQDTVAAIKMASRINKGVKWVAVLNKIKKSSTSHKEAIQWVHSQFADELAAEFGDRVAVADSRDQDEPQAVWQYRGSPRALREQWLDFCKKVLG